MFKCHNLYVDVNAVSSFQRNECSSSTCFFIIDSSRLKAHLQIPSPQDFYFYFSKLSFNNFNWVILWQLNLLNLIKWQWLHLVFILVFLQDSNAKMLFWSLVNCYFNLQSNHSEIRSLWNWECHSKQFCHDLGNI